MLSILAPVVSILFSNIVIRQFLPFIKSLLPDNDFGKTLGTFSLVCLVFGLALLAFMLAARQLHQRSIMSFINTDHNFNWKHYFSGFLIWGSLLFTGSLISNFEAFEVFISHFNGFQFGVLLIVGFVSIGVQSFFEEIIIRGYWLQGLYLRIKSLVVLVLVNAFIFGLLHFGYGIESFLSSWTWGITFALITIMQNRIEFISGAHNANNLLLSLVFLDLSEATNEQFSWSINWLDLSLHIIMLSIFIGLFYILYQKGTKSSLEISPLN